MEKISVIIPVYNVEKYVSQCIESVINQTYKYIEIILVDDGSTDNSGRICDEYAKKNNNIRVIHKENGGLCSARNKGLEISRGNYISFIDSDDFIEPFFLEELYESSIKSDLDICYCNFKLFEEGREFPLYNKDYLKSDTYSSGLEYLNIRFLNNDWHCYVWLGLYKKEFLLKNNLKFYEKERLLYEDILFTNKALLVANKVKFVPMYGYYYRNRWQDSLARQKVNMWTINSYYIIMQEFIGLYYSSKRDNEKKIIIKVLFNVLTGLLESIHYSKEKKADVYYEKIKESNILKILKKSITTKKELSKFIIFSINLRLYYRLADLKNNLVK